MEFERNVKRYREAAAFLPVRLRREALLLPEEQQELCEEFRLRAGRPMTVLLPEGEKSLDMIVEPEDLETLCDLATEFSRYAAVETLREGFLPVRGGFRVGLCGSAVMKGGENSNLKDLSSAAIRISREHTGIAVPAIVAALRAFFMSSTAGSSPSRYCIIRSSSSSQTFSTRLSCHS